MITKLEVIDRLCAVNAEQSRLIRELYAFIDEQMTVEAEIKNKFAEWRDRIDTEADLIEIGLRPYVMGYDCGKEWSDE